METGTRFDLSQLVREANTTTDRVEELILLALLDVDDDGFSPADVGRVRVIEQLVSKGISLEDLARASEAGVVSFSWFDGVLPPPPQLRTETYAELFGQAGVSIGLATTLYEVWGVAMPDLDEKAREDDALLIEYLARFLNTMGGDEDLLVEGTRYFGDSIRRTADAQIAFLHQRVVEPLLATGIPLRDVVELLNPLVTDVIRPGIQTLMAWLNRRLVDAQNMQMLVQMVESALEQSGIEVPKTRDAPAIVFIDLSGYTSRTDELGDTDAAEVATAFSHLVRTETTRHGGSVVKFLGDGVMLHFSKPVDGVRCARELLIALAAAGLPPARAGVAMGTLVSRDGDYFGRTVNLASRIADYARPGELLISETTAEAMAGSIALRPIGPVTLRGVAEPIPLMVVDL
ncbi:MAG: adenylate/guanylate cyclase domain-containing protein [Acidimicrobiia bacterium]